MSRLSTLDRILLFTLVPLFLVVFSLHVRQLSTAGLPGLPVFAVPEWGGAPGAAPLVGGLRLERGNDWNELQVGDRLLRVGDEDLRGRGHFAFDAIALEQVLAGGGTAPLVYERDGERRETLLRVQTYIAPWARAPFVVAFASMAVLVLLRSRSPKRRLFFLAFLGFAIFETPFQGPNRYLTGANLFLFFVGGPTSLYFVLRWVISFPDEVEEADRASPHWAWLAPMAFSLSRTGYYFGGPLPPNWVPYLVVAADLSMATLGVLIATSNYLHATPVGRRRIKWVLLSSYVAVIPVAAISLVAGLGDQALAEPLRVLFQYSQSLAALLPIGCLVAILRTHLFDIDRLLTTTTTYSILLGLSGAALLFGVPPLARTLSSSASDVRALELVLMVGLAILVVPAVRWMRPRLDRALSGRARERERELDQVRHDLRACRTPREVFFLMEARLRTLFDPTHCCLYELREGRFTPLADEHAAAWSGQSLSRALERTPAPRSVGHESRDEDSDLDDADRREVGLRDLRMVVPLRRGKDLAAFVTLGPKPLGDIYTPDDRALLESAAASAATELRRLRDAEVIAAERERAGELKTLKEEAEWANLAKTRFLEAATHELRQPLRQLEQSVARLSDRVRGGPSPASARDAVAKIRSSSHALAEMFDALLDLSVLDAGALQAELRDFDLDPILRRLVSELEAEAQSKGLTLRFEPAPSGARTRSDPQLIGRIVQNLLQNAVRYTEEGWVTLRCPRRGEQWVIEVSDTGPGISPEKQREIFREFVQGKDAEGRGGLGLGLSIVDRLTQLLQLRLELESAPNQGATFRIFLPGSPATPS